VIYREPVCATCEGCGLLKPSPFADDPPTPWSAHVAAVAARLSSGAENWYGSATCAGAVRPVDCPDCGGPADAPFPAAVLLPDFVTPNPFAFTRREGGLPPL